MVYQTRYHHEYCGRYLCRHYWEYWDPFAYSIDFHYAEASGCTAFPLTYCLPSNQKLRPDEATGDEAIITANMKQLSNQVSETLKRAQTQYSHSRTRRKQGQIHGHKLSQAVRKVKELSTNQLTDKPSYTLASL